MATRPVFMTSSNPPCRIGKITYFDSFLTALQTNSEPVRQSPPQPIEVQPVAEPVPLLKINDSITHKLWGKVFVTDISGTSKKTLA